MESTHTFRMDEPKNVYATYRIKQGKCFYTLSLDGQNILPLTFDRIQSTTSMTFAINIPTEENTISPLQKFTGTSVQMKVTTFHTFGCLLYALDSVLASGKNLPKWNARYVLGLYLGNSLRHARSVSQVLNLDTGRISPQFHVIHDEFFNTITIQDKIRTNWKRLAGFAPVHSVLPV